MKNKAFDLANIKDKLASLITERNLLLESNKKPTKQQKKDIEGRNKEINSMIDYIASKKVLI